MNQRNHQADKDAEMRERLENQNAILVAEIKVLLEELAREISERGKLAETLEHRNGEITHLLQINGALQHQIDRIS